MKQLKTCTLVDGLYFVENDEKYITYDNLEECLTSQLNFCGCGNPLIALKRIYEILTTPEKYDGFEFIKYNDNADKLIIMYLLDNLEYIEHGTGINCSWITEKGKNLINDLEIYFEEENAN